MEVTDVLPEGDVVGRALLDLYEGVIVVYPSIVLEGGNYLDIFGVILGELFQGLFVWFGDEGDKPFVRWLEGWWRRCGYWLDVWRWNGCGSWFFKLFHGLWLHKLYLSFYCWRWCLWFFLFSRTLCNLLPLCVAILWRLFRIRHFVVTQRYLHTLLELRHAIWPIQHATCPSQLHSHTIP